MEKDSPAGKTGGDREVGGSSVAVASFDGAAVDPLREASAALDDRDYATSQRIFAAIGRRDVAEAIKDALAALDRKDYPKAQALFEALGQKSAAAAQVNESAPANPAPPKPAAPAGPPMGSVPANEARQKPVTSQSEVIPVPDAAYRRPPPQAEKAKSSRLRPILRGTGVALVAILGVSTIYGSPLNWRLPTTKSQAIAGLSLAADVLKADLEAITGQSAREQERSVMRDLTVRLDQIEHEYGARLDKLSERVDRDSPRFADGAATLDKLETKAALPATPASESGDVAARLDKLEKKVAVAAAPTSEIAGLTTRLNKLEKKAAVAGPSSANPLPPAAPKQSPLMARADPSAPNETAGSDYPAGLFERSPLNETSAAASRLGDNSPGQAKNPPRERASGGCHHYREWRYPWPQQC